MTPKEVLEHDWHKGEKVYVVWHVYDFSIGTRNCYKPMGVVETTVTRHTKDFNRFSQYREIYFDKSVFGKDVPDCDKSMSALREYEFWNGKRIPEQDEFFHKQFCIDKFLTRKEAEKRYKQSVKTWNKAIDREIEKRKNDVQNTKQRYDKAQESANIDISKSKIQE